MPRSPGQGAEPRNSLLQLATKPSPAGQHDADDNDGAGERAVPDNLAAAQSVITQVNTREPPGGPPQYPRGGDNPPPRRSWRQRLRLFLCCFVPREDDAFYRRDEAESVVIRPPQPPTPPRYTGQVLLGPMDQQDRGKKTLVLDLDETLVHSSFRPVPNPDYVIPVEIEGKIVDVYVLKRPWMDEFMASVGQRFEVVVFTASLSKYADPLLDLLDTGSVVRWRLFRESCFPYEGNYVKDLLCLGRPLSDTIIVDNSPHSYVFQPDNAVPIGTFIDDPEDRELLEILPVLLAVDGVDDVRLHLGPQLAKLYDSTMNGHGYSVR
eukprot:jgi/Botrbrau1/5538/Bobra.0023s0022.1